MTTYTATPIVLVNPARAGMILARHIITTHVQGKPRASGDDPTTMAARCLAVQ